MRELQSACSTAWHVGVVVVLGAVLHPELKAFYHSGHGGGVCSGGAWTMTACRVRVPFFCSKGCLLSNSPTALTGGSRADASGLDLLHGLRCFFGHSSCSTTCSPGYFLPISPHVEHGAGSSVSPSPCDWEGGPRRFALLPSPAKVGLFGDVARLDCGIASACKTISA